jgi:hypothetical protein
VDGSSVQMTNIRRPKVAIALGGGGVRGIAHVLTLEAALDEMGICPVVIAGTSMLWRRTTSIARRLHATRGFEAGCRRFDGHSPLFRPVIFGDEMLIDGEAVNPLSCDLRSVLRTSPST